MQMPGGHLLAAGLDGGNSIRLRKAEAALESHHWRCQSRLLWHLQPNGTILSIFRISRQNRIGRGNLVAVIQMCVDIGGCSNISVSKTFLNLFQRNTVGIQQAGAIWNGILQAFSDVGMAADHRGRGASGVHQMFVKFLDVFWMPLQILQCVPLLFEVRNNAVFC